MKKVRDERVLQLNNKIQSEAFILILGLLGLSIFIKSYVLNMSTSNYITELILLILSMVYISIRSSFVGLDSFGNTKKFVLPLSIITGLIIAITNGIKNYSLYGNKYNGITDGHFLAVLVITFIFATVFVYVTIGVLYFIDEYGKKRLDKKMSEED
ncbi:DUF6773 family protein [Enterococcus durans]|uniref:DUF6773 family protein n=1 Tax=Enterococcus durans TaxID=53345 RepID=UPI0011589D8F|nr:DUF6773 family protein [Enterococcus durans]MBC9720170.1 hypothetical protein [Lactobacillus sp.]